MGSDMVKEAQDFLEMVIKAPTSYHASIYLSENLKNSHEVEESTPFSLEKGKTYYVRRGSSLIAFRLPLSEIKRATILASHIDSPGLKLKPACQGFEHMELLSTEVYGSPLLSSWMGREFTIAGKVAYEENGSIKEKLVHFKETPCVLASPPIHLDSSLNDEGLKIDKQLHLRPLFGLNPQKKGFLSLLGEENILASDLFLIPTDLPAIIGKENTIISSYRIDNLSSVFASLKAFNQTKARNHTLQMLVFFDHEEIGSSTEEGAFSSFFEEVLRRILISQKMTEPEIFYILKQNSFAVSLDAAHSYHPNYPSLFDEANAPKMGKGIAIKMNAKRRYASSCHSTATLRYLLLQRSIPHQFYFGHSGKPCGSTIGPIFATKTGIETIDVGAPILGMHSVKEQMGVADLLSLIELSKAVLEEG